MVLACHLVLGMLWACESPPAQAGAAPKEVRRPVPQRPPLPTVEGLKPVYGHELVKAVAAAGDKATVVNIWASWCGSCKKEIPMLLELAEDLKPQGVRVLFVSADKPPSWEAAVALLKERKVPLPSYVFAGGLRSFRYALDKRWEGAVPATFLLDAQGKVQYFWNGPVFAHEVAPIVQSFLAGERVEGMADYAAPRVQ